MSMTADAIQKIADQALAAVGHDLPKVQGIGHVVALPDGMTIQSIEQYLPLRANFRGALATHLPTEFANYVKQHGGVVYLNDANMSAKAIFDLGTVKEPGHCRHTAGLSLRQTGAYAALRNFLGSAHSQRDMSDWLEDWRDNLTVFNVAGEAMHILQAVQAARTLSVEEFKKRQSIISETKESMSAFEQVEAKSEFPIPHALVFTCVPYEGLPARQFAIRLNIITSGDKPVFKPRMLQEETQQEAIVADFKALVGNLIGDAAPIIVGTFDAR